MPTVLPHDQHQGDNVNVLAIIAASYAIGVVITYGILIDHPEHFDLDERADELRATQPNASEREVQEAMRLGHKLTSIASAIVWPLMVGAALLDLASEIRRRLNTRK